MKIFLKKAWVFVKTYWYIFLILILGVVAFLTGRSRDVKELFNVIQKEREAGKKEIEIIEDTHRKIEEEKERNLAWHDAEEERLKKEYEEKVIKLEKKNDQLIEKMSNDIKAQPDKTLSKIAREMGWDYDR